MLRRNTAVNESTSKTNFISRGILPEIQVKRAPSQRERKKGAMSFLRLWMVNLRRNHREVLIYVIALAFASSVGFNVMSFHASVATSKNIERGIRRVVLESKPRTLLLGNDALTKMREYNPLDWEYPIHINDTLPIRKNDDKKYERYRMHLADESTQCPFIADWQSQRSAKPSCNTIHEIELRVGNPGVSNNLRFLDDGAFKMVWDVLDEEDEPQNFVLKTAQRYSKFQERDFYKHARDALVLEQGTSSPSILNMYSWCSNSGIVERAYGTLGHWVMKNRNRVSSVDLLEVTVLLSRGVSDMHNFHNGMATVAHADIKPAQYLLTSGEENPNNLPSIKLNDFNRCEFLTSNRPPEVCPFYIDAKHKSSTYRSPEEYVPHGPQTDKIDVFSLGSVLYFLLEGKEPFVDVEDYEQVQKNIIEGVEPDLSNSTAHSKDPSILAIVQAMRRCRRVHPEDRPQSRDIAKFLSTELERIKRNDK